jgi:peroxiredoxin
MTPQSSDETPDRPDTASSDPATPGPPGAGTAGVDDPSDGPPPSRKRWVVAAMGALALALFAVPFLRGPDYHDDAAGANIAGQDGTCSASRGVANLDFTLTDIDGAEVRLSDYRGKVILLNFWATWCAPCKIEIPDFVEVYDEYRERGLEILGVLNLDEPSPAELRAFAAQFRMNYPIFRASDEFEAANGPIWGLPTTFLIDRQGSICSKHMGPVSKETVEREIKGLL